MALHTLPAITIGGQAFPGTAQYDDERNVCILKPTTPGQAPALANDSFEMAVDEELVFDEAKLIAAVKNSTLTLVPDKERMSMHANVAVGGASLRVATFRFAGGHR